MAIGLLLDRFLISIANPHTDAKRLQLSTQSPGGSRGGQPYYAADPGYCLIMFCYLKGDGNLCDGNRLDFDSMIVFGTDPIHSARHVAIFHDFGRYHRSAALRTGISVSSAFVTKTCTGCFGNFLCH
jgi:hypothetical protein